MNILYCGDKNIQDGVIISVLSLLKHVREPLHIYLLTADAGAGRLPQRFAEFLDRQVKEQNPENSVRSIDISALFYAQPPTANLKTRFTPCCMLRLYADLVEELPDRLLYLDNDVICREDPGGFYDQDLSSWELAGCLDYYGSWFFRKHLFKRDYLNSGVLLLNMKAIRTTGLFETCRDKCRNETMFMPDQSAINKLCCRKKICPRKYNEQRKLRRTTVFQHFTTGFRFFPWFHTVSVKPWNVKAMHNTLHLHEYDDILQSYLRLKKEISYGSHILFH